MNINIQTWTCSKCSSTFSANLCPRCKHPRLMNADEVPAHNGVITASDRATIRSRHNNRSIKHHEEIKSKSGEFYQSCMSKK